MNKYIVLSEKYKTLIAGVKYKISQETVDVYVVNHIEIPKNTVDIKFYIGSIETI